MSVQELSENTIEAIAGIAFEIGRRARAEVEERALWKPSSALWEREVERIARAKAQSVLVDYFVGQFKPLACVVADDGSSITCTRCGMTSYNLNDVQKRFCGHCERFRVNP